MTFIRALEFSLERLVLVSCSCNVKANKNSLVKLVNAKGMAISGPHKKILNRPSTFLLSQRKDPRQMAVDRPVLNKIWSLHNHVRMCQRWVCILVALLMSRSSWYVGIGFDRMLPSMSLWDR